MLLLKDKIRNEKESILSKVINGINRLEKIYVIGELENLKGLILSDEAKDETCEQEEIERILADLGVRCDVEFNFETEAVEMIFNWEEMFLQVPLEFVVIEISGIETTHHGLVYDLNEDEVKNECAYEESVRQEIRLYLDDECSGEEVNSNCKIKEIW